MNYTIKHVNINQIRHGDTIIHNGEMKTVDRHYIKSSDFMGTTLFGDSYMLGTKPVQKVIFNTIKQRSSY